LGQDIPQSLYVKTKSKAVIGYIPYFVNLLRLCLERIKLYGRLQEISIHDSLTKVYNRRYFTQRFSEEFSRANTFGLNLAFLMADIDNFKRINDTYGHLVGDAVLREVARLIQESTRGIDFVARFGGEEFAVILPETDKAGAIMVGERIRSRISMENIVVFDETLVINVSVGVAAFPQNTLYPDVLIETADKALYKAKTSGKNRVAWF
jgi:diguanylate cyclase (GGDEF)-like protein